MDIGKIDYKSLTAPDAYKCTRCGVKGVKLWRQYQTIADAIDLLCADCAVQEEEKDWEVGEDGRHACDLTGQRSDQIGWLVPAIPTEEGDTYWGYTSVPALGCAWWFSLPTRLLGQTEIKRYERIRQLLLKQVEDLNRLWEDDRDTIRKLRLHIYHMEIEKPHKE